MGDVDNWDNVGCSKTPTSRDNRYQRFSPSALLAEEAVSEVKRQALLELERAVGAAELKASQLVAGEKAKLDRLLSEPRRPQESPPESNHNVSRSRGERGALRLRTNALLPVSGVLELRP